jgi:protease PrsW
VLPVLVGLLPVLSFLAALLYLDSYKLVSLRAIVALVACGAAVAGTSYLVNVRLLDALPIDFTLFTRYISPFSEELLKGLIVVALIRAHRIGFLVDAAIAGFAVGTGFALVENLYYLNTRPDASMGVWIVRGFGTAIMHGGVTAIFGVMGLALVERMPLWRAVIPGYVVAVVIHSIFNHFFLSPFISTVGIAIALPLLLSSVFTHSEAALGQWLGKGFDADAEMLELIDSGSFSDSRVGRYLHELRDKFEGPVVADLLCYLRIYTELALKAKGILIMREAGFDATIDEGTREKFAELRYLEKSIGKTGRLAIQPMLHMSHKELWQLYMIGA